jgi:hypothetical protein
MMRAPALRRLALVLAALAAGAAVSDASAATLTVINTDDGGPGSLRQAVLDANAAPGPDVILFAIPGTGVHVIQTWSPLYVTESVLIDGYSQPGSSWNTDASADNAVIQVEVWGQGTAGFAVQFGSTTIQGLSIYGFETGITLNGESGNVVQGNFVGVTTSGQEYGNLTGILVSGSTGLDRIGDADPAGRNLISANSIGIRLLNADGTEIVGNLIGTDASGSMPSPNATGVALESSVNVHLGADGPGHNVISGNTDYGVSISSAAFDSVLGNFIGTDASGESPLGNGAGVRVVDASESLAIEGNVISANAGNGVELSYPGTPGHLSSSLEDNRIGTNAAGTRPLGNAGAGVFIESAGDVLVRYNTIANNRVGLWRTSPTTLFQFTVSQNSMWGNRGGLGIVLGADETIAPNATGSAFNFPIVQSVTTAGGTTHIDGYYRGPADVGVQLEFFATSICSAGPQEFTEGRTWFGSYGSATDASGYMPFSVDFDAIGADETAVATATVILGPAESLETSPFSQRLPFSISPTSGAAAGSEPVTILGTDFDAAADVTIGGQPVGNLVLTGAKQIEGSSPALPAGAAYDVVVTNPGAPPSALRLAWVADFLDVPASNAFHDAVVTLTRRGITGGVGGGNYGVSDPVLRQQMAVFLLKAEHGACWAPPPCLGFFADVPCPSLFADWVETLAFEEISAGCGGGNYCPSDPVRRDQMAVFLLKTEHGGSYVPPACTGVFDDEPCPSPFADWVERLAAEGVTAGCGGGNYCPAAPNTRGQMAVFLSKTFSLPLFP